MCKDPASASLSLSLGLTSTVKVILGTVSGSSVSACFMCESSLSTICLPKSSRTTTRRIVICSMLAGIVYAGTIQP
ncbi:hypothetical protein BVRB_6g131750 [Beta vulgaris subsp. vulgaris]|nr:hypothetical protein BVRB_6g131750 [Beta vulgaris subsp. vulgaris]